MAPRGVVAAGDATKVIIMCGLSSRTAWSENVSFKWEFNDASTMAIPGYLQTQDPENVTSMLMFNMSALSDLLVRSARGDDDKGAVSADCLFYARVSFAHVGVGIELSLLTVCTL